MVMAAKKRKASEKSTEEVVTKQSGSTAVANGTRQGETSFPRGGASVLTPLEHKEISIKAAKDLFSGNNNGIEEPAKKRLKADKSKKTTLKKKSKKKEPEVKVEKSTTQVIHDLSFKQLTPETVLLGCISQINELELVVSLPYQLHGVVPITEISDPLTAAVERVANQQEDEDEDEEDESRELPDLNKLFRVGQYVPCRISSVKSRAETKKKNSIELTLRPESVNRNVPKVDVAPGVALSAYVQSAEDHGYVLSFGIKDLTGFCKNADAKKYIKEYNNGNPLVPGQIVQCVALEEANKKRTVKVTLDYDKVAQGVVQEPSANVEAVVPGLLVKGTVQAVEENGLSIKFMGLYDATIDAVHLPQSSDNYKIGENIQFRILFCIFDSEPKRIAGTLLSHLIHLNAPKDFTENLRTYGTMLDKVTVTRVAGKKGVFVSIDDLEDVRGFVHISNLTDGRIDKLTKDDENFSVGSEHRARVLNYSALDALVLLTTKESTLEDAFMRISDVPVGEEVDGTVVNVVDAGIIVRLSSTIQALVPTMHMADVKLTHPEIKFKKDSKVRARVLSVDPGKRRVYLTLKRSLLETNLPLIKDWESLEEGVVSHGTIISIRDRGATVRFYNNISGFVPASHMTETKVANLSSVFRLGQTVKATVMKLDKADNLMLLSLIKAAQAKREEKKAKKQAKDAKYAVGQIVSATIKEIKPTQLNIELENGREGRVHINEAFTSLKQIKNRRKPLSGNFKKGESIQVKIVGSRESKTRKFLPISATGEVKSIAECSLNTESDKVVLEQKDFKVGDQVLGFVKSVEKRRIEVTLGMNIMGQVRNQLVSKDLDYCRNHKFIVGEAVPVEVLSKDEEHHVIELIAQDKSIPRIHSIDSVEEGMVGIGLVTKIMRAYGLVVQLSSGVNGRVHRIDLLDSYTENPTESFKEGMLVRYAVAGVDKDKKRIELSLRQCHINPEAVEENSTDKEINSVEDLETGQVLSGYVDNVANSGVFISLGRKVNARVKIAHISDEFIKEWQKVFKVGQLVRCKILHVDVENKQVEATLKKSLIEGIPVPKKKKKAQVEDSDEEMEDASSDDNDEEGEEEEDEEEEKVEEDSDEEVLDVMDIDEDMLESAQQKDEDSSDEDASSDEEDDTDALKINGGFDWTGQVPDDTNQDDDASSDESSSDEEDDKHKKNKGKKQQVEDKTAELSTNAPQSAADYERLLVGSPDSSYMWINYMAHQLQLSEIEKAREIGERALTTINFREEQEKLNVWVAMLNLENSYGNDETLDAIFKRACVYCEAEKVYLQLANIYERSNKVEKAEALWQDMTKQFSQNPKVWTQFGLFYLKQENVEGARQLLQRSLKVLPKFAHIETISKFAQMEFKHGEPERGRTIFEGLLSNHPKRIDLWSVFLDMEIKAGDQDMIRRLFERVTAMKISSKKMKFFFKKWLQYENEHGTEDDADRVKEKALEYVNNA
ncbi:hypothetical protein BDA99DRAFT_542639 [Phascolomyces articulosus]|uniref:Protein RRP5 homolog n=1 Tax=Phascolomyces articulosus TaxID=60185 RepID=A0AAD5P922_9FUNG|nr:hypothetical protein BDA99DRAFT_542639 [Phascolomyces articulosus]